MIERFFKYKFYFLIINDFILLILSNYISLYLTGYDFLKYEYSKFILLLSFLIYFCSFSFFKIYQDSLSFPTIRLFNNLVISLITFSFFFIIFYKFIRFFGFIEPVNKFWVIYILSIFTLFLSSRFIFFFFINIKKQKILNKNLYLIKDNSFNLKSIIRIKEFISDFNVSGIVEIDLKDLRKKIDNFNYLSLDNFSKYKLLENDTFLIICNNENNSRNINKLLTAIDCKINQIKILNNLNFNLSTLLQKQINLFSDVNLEDLILRKKIEPINTIYEDFIFNKSIMIIGAGGSIGKVIFEKIISLKAKNIILIDSDEESVFNLQQLKFYNEGNVKCHLVNVSIQSNYLNNLFDKYKPDIIFNTAANKHVKIFDENIIESTRNTIDICINSIELAIKYNVKNYILISSDKAINPSSQMGKIKNICEKICSFHNNDITKISCVRFGNVIGSSGSVIPIFQKLIQDRMPLIIRHKDLTRYFMSINEAAELVIQSCALSEGSDIFTLDMGSPVKIEALAKKIISFNGLSIKDEKNPNGDIEIKYSKLLPGEKIHEEIFTENKTPTIHPKIFSEKISFNKTEYQKSINLLKESIHKDDRKSLEENIDKFISI